MPNAALYAVTSTKDLNAQLRRRGRVREAALRRASKGTHTHVSRSRKNALKYPEFVLGPERETAGRAPVP